MDRCRYRLGERLGTNGGRGVNPRPLTEREQTLIDSYSHCQLAMTPQRFRSKWSLTYSQMACVCDRSVPTVSFWFSHGRLYRRPTKADLRHLALMDFLLEHSEAIPPELRDLLCPPRPGGG